MFATRSAFVAVLALCGLISVAPSVATADREVSGSINVDGKPLAAGKIAFHRDNGQFVGSKVKDGKFSVDRVPSGTLKVTLEGKGVPLAYASEDTSGLVVQVVQDGPNRFDFDLKTSKPK
ncbi:MAG: hypothetical protein ACYC0X_34445 [Pirellulaceae bacterium]